MSETKDGYVVCEWCGCQSWWPRNRLTLTSDSGRTITRRDEPLTVIPGHALHLVDKLIDMTAEEKLAALKSMVNFAYSEDELETEDPNYDPTPYCSGCKAMTRAQCNCGPIAGNE